MKHTFFPGRFFWVLCLLFTAFPVLADALPSYQPNPKENQFDYWARDEKSMTRVRVAEQYHWNPGLECERRKDFPCAFGSWDFILRWVPNHTPALQKMVNLVTTSGRPALALPYLEAATQFCPKCADVYVVYGIYLFNIKQVDKSIEKYKISIDIDPNLPTAYYNLGLAYLSQKRYKEANEVAQKAYDLGYPFPFLRDKLKQLGAWNQTSKSTEKAEKAEKAEVSSDK